MSIFLSYIHGTIRKFVWRSNEKDLIFKIVLYPKTFIPQLMGFMIFFFSFVNTIEAQTNNLVLNPSFEDYNQCTIYRHGLSAGYAKDWNVPHVGVNDYFHACSNDSFYTEVGIPSNIFYMHFPNRFFAYADVALYINDGSGKSYREYVQGSLSDSLIPGRLYIVNFFLTLGNKVVAPLCIDNIGVYFSDSILNFGNVFEEQTLPLVPQFRNSFGNILLMNKNGWQKVEGTFIAGGGEKYFTIGNFDDNAHTNIYDCFGVGADSNTLGYVYPALDDVSVIDPTLIDTVHLCMNDSLYLEGAWRHSSGLYYDTMAGIPYQRFLQASSYASTHTHILKTGHAGDSIKTLYFWTKITPGMDSTVVLNLPSFTGCDSIVYCRVVDNTAIDELAQAASINDLVNIYPNPSSQQINIKYATKDAKNMHVVLYDFMGQEISSKILQNNSNANAYQVQLHIADLSSGIYFVKLFQTQHNTEQEEFIASGKFIKE